MQMLILIYRQEEYFRGSIMPRCDGLPSAPCLDKRNDNIRQYVVCLCIPKTSTDHKISVNVSTRYHVRIATRPILVRPAFGVRLQEHRQEVSQRDVRAYTRNTSRSLAGEQNKSAVTDHAISLNHVRLGSGQSHRQRKQQSEQMDQGGDTYQEGSRQVDEQRRGVLSTLPHL